MRANQQHERIIDKPHQPGRIHFGRDRHNSTITLREAAARGFHLSNEESDFLFLRLRYLLQAGQFGDAFTALACQILDLQAGRSIFLGFDSPGEMPLGMTRIPQQDINLLAGANCHTVGQWLDADREQLLELDHLTPRRLDRIGQVVDDLVTDYSAWRRTLGEASESDANASAEQQAPTVEAGRDDASPATPQDERTLSRDTAANGKTVAEGSREGPTPPPGGGQGPPEATQGAVSHPPRPYLGHTSVVSPLSQRSS